MKIKHLENDEIDWLDDLLNTHMPNGLDTSSLIDTNIVFIVANKLNIQENECVDAAFGDGRYKCVLRFTKDNLFIREGLDGYGAIMDKQPDKSKSPMRIAAAILWGAGIIAGAILGAVILESLL